VGITVTDLAELSTTEVQQAQAQATQLLQEEFPSLELRRGVVHDLVIAPHAIFATAQQENVDRLRRSMSLQAILDDPALADDDTVDSVASNFLVTRRAGALATGHVTVIISAATSVTIAAGTVFSAQGQAFVTTTSFASRTAAAAITTATDRLLTALDNGTYAFVIDVTASEAGSAARLVKDTQLEPGVAIPYFVEAYATEDFSGGQDEETNAELLARLVSGVSARAFSGRVHMSAALRAREDFSGIVADSIVGFGDVEMLRDAHTIFPGSVGGGRVDWYVRTQERPSRVLLTKTATLVATDAATGKGIWQFSLGRDDAPGFYDCVSIVKSGASAVSGTYQVMAETGGYDLTALDNDGFLPDIASADEAAYSRFQTRVIRFLDTDTSITGLTAGASTQSYAVTVRAMPLVAELQDYASSRGTRNYGGDVLVKAPVPCFLSLSFRLELPPGAAEPDTDAIKTALARAVNRFGFTGKLPAAYLADVIHGQLGSQQAYLGAIDMFGRIRQPNQGFRYIRATDVLDIPAESSQMLSGRTVAFILEPADVAITLATADVPEV